MRIPGFIRGKANAGNKVAQAFIQQYDNGDNAPYDPEAYASLKVQMQGAEEDYQDYEMDVPREEDFTPEEQKANDRIEELGDKYGMSGMTEEEKEIYEGHKNDLDDYEEDLTPQQNARFDEKSELIKKYSGMGYQPDEAQLHAEKDMVEKDNQELYEELGDNEYIYGNLDKENIAKVLGERTGKSKEAIESFMNEKYKEGFWDEDAIEPPTEEDLPSEEELQKKKYEEEKAKLDKKYPTKGDPKIEKEIMDVIDKEDEWKNATSKYPDVEKTEWPHVYHVNGLPITNLAMANSGTDDDTGFSVTKYGREKFYKTFDEAYQAAKGMSPEKKNIFDKKEPANDLSKISNEDLLNKIDSLDFNFGVKGLENPEERLNLKKKYLEELRKRLIKKD